MKIIIYTGSFNPITNGHVLTMDAAMKEVNADKGFFVMVHENYLMRKMYEKNNTSFVLKDEEREQMITAVCNEYEKLEFGDRQVGCGNPSTIKTLMKFKRKYKNSEIYLLLGADKLYNFSKWDDAQEIIDIASVIVAARKDFNITEVINNDDFLIKNKDKFIITYPDKEALNISSSIVRNKILNHEDYSNLIPKEAYDIIKLINTDKFKELTYEDRIYFNLHCCGVWGSEKACELVYESNCKLFKKWNEDLLGNKDSLLNGTIPYKDEFKTNYNFNYETIFECVNKDCVDVALELLNEGYNPSILNLASRFSPGGGYHHFRNAQEESLCQMSTLSQSLYQFGDIEFEHIKSANLPNYPGYYPMDINFGGIYSPNVVFFRNNKSLDFTIKEKPFSCSVVTVASLSNNDKKGKINHERKYFDTFGYLTKEGTQIEINKIRTIFRIALKNGHNSIVLGAFGCGYFKLIPSEVANLFNQVLNEPEFKGNFKKIVFAILERRPKDGRPTGKDGKFKPFYDLFNN